MSVQKYETDILQEHVDSTTILILRLEQWRKGLQVVHEYVQGYQHMHAGVTAHLEKTLKSISELPSFSQPQELQSQSASDAPNPSSLSNVFPNLQSNINSLLQKSATATNGIKTSVLPPLEQLQVDIDKHYKALKIQGGKGIREVERARETTQKAIEQRGRVTSSFGTRALTYQEDPYVIHRRVEAAVLDQISKENIQAEAALGIQRNFATLEHSIIETLRQSLVSLTNMNESFDNDERDINANIAKLFTDIDMEKEWAQFSMTNSEHLVPSSNFQRDPQYVTFVNQHHASCQPLIQGPLQRKGTVLKSYNQGYYVLTPSGFLYQFKHPEPAQDTMPEMGLYLPECQVSKSNRIGKYTFLVVGKDAQKKITTRHKFAFKTSSQQELDQWYSAICRITGNVGTFDEDDDDTVPSAAQSPLSARNSTFPDGPVSPVSSNDVNVAPAASASASASAAAAAAATTSHVPTQELHNTGLSDNDEFVLAPESAKDGTK